jgi:hypothetical protein
MNLEQSYWMRAINWTHDLWMKVPQDQKKWQIEAKPPWHHFLWKFNWVEPPREERDLTSTSHFGIKNSHNKC